MAKTKMEIVKKTNVEKEDGWWYVIDSDGNVSRTKRTSPDITEKVEKTGIKIEKNYFYFVTKNGDIARTKVPKYAFRLLHPEGG